MKKLIVIGSIIVSAVSAFAWTNNVTAVSSYIAPGRDINSQYIPARTNAMVVGAGQYVRVTGRIYMATEAGTTTNPPAGNDGWATEDGVGWLSVHRGKRSYLGVQNYSTSIVSIAFGAAATVSDGIRIGANELWESDMPPQTSIQAITSGGSNSVAVIEW